MPAKIEVDILEDCIRDLSPDVLNTLLKDNTRSTDYVQANIFWATHDYEAFLRQKRHRLVKERGRNRPATLCQIQSHPRRNPFHRRKNPPDGVTKKELVNKLLSWKPTK